MTGTRGTVPPRPDDANALPVGATLDHPREFPVDGGILHTATGGPLLFLGPWTPDGASGCARCAGLWRYDVEGETAVHRPTPDGLLDLWEGVFDALVAATDPTDLRLSLIALDRRDGTLTRHRFVPHPHCDHCPRNGDESAVADDTDPLGLETPAPTVGDSLRVRRMDREVLRERLLDFRFGPAAHMYRDEESPLALVTCETVAPGRTSREGGYGRSTRFTDSEVPALLEGVERVTGGRRLSRTPTVRGSYAELASDAVDPALLGLHEEEWYGHPSFDPIPYTPATPTTWVWGWSTRERRRVLVPEHVAYWHAGPREERFLYESSNGCAVGGSPAEAVLYGLFEVVERDAFLLTWYSRTRPRRIEGVDDPDLNHLTDLITERGLELSLLDITSDLGVPTVLAMVTAEEGAVREGLAPALSLATGTHLDPRRALMAAVEETATNALMYPKWVRMRESVSVERCRPMLDDFTLIRTLEDHTGVFGLWEARPMWEFLRRPAGVVGMDELVAGRPSSFAGADLAAVLRERLAAVHALGLDVIVVDQSGAPYTEAVGAHSVKVIVPGALPMTFGHTHLRIRSLERLTRASDLIEGGIPWETPGEVYPIPHPFP
ncbi:YcaO-like family protein [Nocardiopsis alba]|uniref:YcaO-like family protein n=1 Tax=Nocardiopsis alba TaxID=53437 RepID=UPI0036C5A95B